MFPAAHEVMGSHSWQSQKSGLGLCLNDWFLRANNLDCWRASWRRKAFGCACEWFKAIMVHWQLYGLLKTGLLNDSGEPGINGTNPTGVLWISTVSNARLWARRSRCSVRFYLNNAYGRGKAIKISNAVMSTCDARPNLKISRRM